ncbi:Haloacid dehalogenase-like hydrolase domain-containing protein 2 [Hyaloraphidium curvatum]|nr:Haloacid dehalogenase-like hydrolase domain-containing protein 2 [Hyaloraphidium curvatum]
MPPPIKAVLVDLSGTLHVEHDPTRDAIAALSRLRTRCAVRFVSNTSKESSGFLLMRLHAMGFELAREELFTSLVATRREVERRGVRPMLLLEPEALEDFVGIETDAPNAVVVGLAPKSFHYERLSEAMRVLLDSGGPIIAIHKGRYLARKDGLAMGPGPFVHALEYATDREATVVGKPSPEFFASVLADLGAAPEECAMIGDDVRDDVGGAMAAGMRGILVRTGKYRAGDEAAHGVNPTVVVADFAEAVDLILEGRV